ncbi:tetratricopeptide repeat protein [Herpetosiphon llansteffanensis]|uniref:tetratricopeptide repeat protein n=1 Tax=Herpetosiphon llansteffanensis TaxID=2094568 RepID=UPI000D7C1A3A|nr:hypothetical protein [Herpetosiphon llansteffanensis]
MNELNQAQAALLSGDLARARGHLALVIQQEPANVLAWLMLSEVVHQPERQRECLQRVLALEPHNQTAQKRLAAIDQPVIAPAKPAIASSTGQKANQQPQQPRQPSNKPPTNTSLISMIGIAIALVILLIVAVIVLRGIPESPSEQSQSLQGLLGLAIAQR